jgi:hypothetical protein
VGTGSGTTAIVIEIVWGKLAGFSDDAENTQLTAKRNKPSPAELPAKALGRCVVVMLANRLLQPGLVRGAVVEVQKPPTVVPF